MQYGINPPQGFAVTLGKQLLVAASWVAARPNTHAALGCRGPRYQ